MYPAPEEISRCAVFSLELGQSDTESGRLDFALRSLAAMSATDLSIVMRALLSLAVSNSRDPGLPFI